MTSKALIRHFLPKNENVRTQEIKQAIVEKLATILRRLNIEDKVINGKKMITLTTT